MCLIYPAFKSQQDDPMVAGGDVAQAMKPPDSLPPTTQVPAGRPYMWDAHNRITFNIVLE